MPHNQLKALFSKLSDISKELKMYLFTLWGFENWLWKKKKYYDHYCGYIFKFKSYLMRDWA